MKTSSFYAVGALAVLAWSCGPSLKTAQESYKLGQYQKAIPIYEKLLLKDEFASQKGKLNYTIAESYRLSGNLDKALPYYEKADKAKYLSNNLGFYYGQALKFSGNYAGAKELYERYVKIATDRAYIHKFNDEIKFIENLETWLQQPTYITVRIADSVNTSDDEVGAVSYGDGIVLTSNRRKEKISPATATGFNDLYFAKIATDEKTVLFGEGFNLDGVNDEYATFTADRNTVVFVRSSRSKDKSPFKESHLYVSTFANGYWSTPQLLKATSLNNCLNTTPYLSPDGSTLYFASNRIGGYGGFDLYRAKRDDKGNFGMAENLGKEINTIGDEISPFVDSKNRLFFASDGHVGLGGLDIFMAEKNAEGKVVIKNFGVPVNSRFDDFALFFKTEIGGYFTSNRKEVTSKGGYDIYEFSVGAPPKIVNYFVSGITQADLDSMTALLDGVEVKLLDGDNQIDVTHSDSKGNFKFAVRIDHQKTYKIVAYRKGYLPNATDFSVGENVLSETALTQPITNHTVGVTLVLKPNLFVNPDTSGGFFLDALSFAPEDTILNENAQKALVSVIDYLRAFPDQKVVFHCHSDETKDKSKNLALTEKRAQTIMSYLLEAGIDPERILAQGKGDTQVKVKKPKTDADRRVNRRIVFRFEPKSNS